MGVDKGAGDLRRGWDVLAWIRALGCAAMDEDQADWWMDARKRWRRGRPPAGWWQGDDRRWHPPDEYQPATNVAYRPPARPAHLIGGSHSPPGVTWRGWLARVFYVVLALAVVVTVTVIVFAALADRGGASDDGGTASIAASRSR